ncbi:glycoside hydrolase family 13 protein [Zhihengliuella flava]|uniref:Alpha-glucosidase n=1 Tax=Zhihengliuella flava TaxID=1285193 RepID=A0A931GMA1_9MICC|nr:glycoside hydrolase family 13 protein [Zhihengliuella flava]MBG6085219.1 alpha-glucosidase [Zhihengliuella flava]
MSTPPENVTAIANIASWPHHDESSVGVSTLFPELGEELTVRLRVPRQLGPVEGVWLRSLRDGEPHFDAAELQVLPADGAQQWQWYTAPLRVVNPVQRYRWALRLRGRTYWLNAAGFFNRDVRDDHDFRVVALDREVADPTPDWVHRSVMYQVFPDRFARSAQADLHPTPEWALACEWDTTEVIGRGPQTPFQFYGGDLPGITEKLGHLQELGATVLYVTPMFPARSNHRYDAADFAGVDPLLGGDEALIELVEQAHARGLRVIGDLTTNHSGDAHEWFRSARADRDAPEADFYYFDDARENYVAWLGVDSLPKFNWNSRTLREKFVLDEDSMVARWLKPPFNLDGWRIDVGNMTGRQGRDDLNHDVAAVIRRRLHEVRPDAMLLAESTSDAAADFQGHTWQGAMTYTNFTRPLWHWLAGEQEPTGEPWFFGVPPGRVEQIDGEDFLATHLDFVSGFPWTVRRCNLNALDTHDTARAAHAMRPGGQAVGAVLQYAMPGIPMVFMGDEFGLTGWNGEASRTPMPWNDPSRIGEDLRGLYGELGRVRSQSQALLDGGIRWICAEENVLVFVREHPEQTALVVAARDDFSLSIEADVISAAPAEQWRPAVSARGGVGLRDDAGVVHVTGTGGPAAAVWLLPGVE